MCLWIQSIKLNSICIKMLIMANFWNNLYLISLKALKALTLIILDKRVFDGKSALCVADIIYI